MGGSFCARAPHLPDEESQKEIAGRKRLASIDADNPDLEIRLAVAVHIALNDGHRVGGIQVIAKLPVHMMKFAIADEGELLIPGNILSRVDRPKVDMVGVKIDYVANCTLL